MWKSRSSDALLLALALVALVAMGCAHGNGAETASAEAAREPGVITAAVPDRPAGARVSARVEVGPLPRGARVVVRLADPETGEVGELIGSIAPYGLEATRSGGGYEMPLPERVWDADEVGFTFEVEEPDGEPRPAREGEVVAVEVMVAPTG